MAGVGAVAAVVAVGVAVVVVTQGDGGGGSGCVTGLVDHIPSDATFVQGSDLDRARRAGFDDDGDIEQVSKSVVATGVMLDPVSGERLRSFDDSPDTAGYESADVECWLGPIEPGFVARGRFDGDRIGGSELGEDGSLVLEQGLLARSPEGDPGDLLAGEEQPATVRGLVEGFDRHGAISFTAIAMSDDKAGPWSGIALARGDDWDLLVMWSLPDADAARDAEADVREVLAGESSLGSMVDGDPADTLQRDGTTLWLRAPLADDPASWPQPLRYLDPIFTTPSTTD